MESQNFIKVLNQCTEVHGGKYDYSKAKPAYKKDKITIICPTHGDFRQQVYSHLKGTGCPRCGVLKRAENRKANSLKSKYKNIKQPAGYKIIPLTRGKFSKIDNEDFEKVREVNWGFGKRGYAMNRRVGTLHRFILNLKDPTILVDHINRDKLDNRRCNLRCATLSQNGANSKARQGISKYKGVTWDKRCRKWVAQISVNYKNIFLGHFDSEEEAARERDKKSKEFQGDFAYLNFPKQ